MCVDACVLWCVYVSNESIYILRIFNGKQMRKCQSNQKKIQKSPIWEAGTLRFSNANLFRPKKLHSYPIRIFNRIAFN